MKKKILLPVIVLVFCLMNILVAFAEDVAKPEMVMDEAGLLTAEQKEALNNDFIVGSGNIGADILVATVESRGSKEADALAQEKYEAYMKTAGKKDGVLLLLCMAESDWAVYAEGKCQSAITKDGLDMIKANVFPDVADGNYVDAFSKYMQTVVVLAAKASTGEAYTAKFNVGSHIAIALVIGLIIALIVTGSMKGQLNSVHRQQAAASYIKQNSMHVTKKQEIYLYKKLEKTQKADSSANVAAANANAPKSASGKF